MNDWTRREFLAASTAGGCTAEAHHESLAAPAEAAARSSQPQPPRRAKPAAVPRQREDRAGLHRRRRHGDRPDQHVQGVPAGRDRGGLRRLRAPPAPGASRRPAGRPRPTAISAGCSTARTSTRSWSPRPTTGTRSSTILACQAGKDVYCEKPLAHRIQEGRAMVTGGREVQARHPDGQPDPRRRELPPGRRDRPLGRAGQDQQDAGLDGRRPPRPGPARRTARRPRAAITTSGSAPPRCGRSTPTASRSTGGTSGTTAAASSRISAATSSTWSTGRWTSRRPGPSRRSAAATPSTTTPKCPIRSRSPTNTRKATRSS